MSKRGYMCAIDFDHEAGDGGDIYGVRVYPSMKALKAAHKCWRACGIVEVDIKYVMTRCNPARRKRASPKATTRRKET